MKLALLFIFTCTVSAGALFSASNALESVFGFLIAFICCIFFLKLSFNSANRSDTK